MSQLKTIGIKTIGTTAQEQIVEEMEGLIAKMGDIKSNLEKEDYSDFEPFGKANLSCIEREFYEALSTLDKLIQEKKEDDNDYGKVSSW